MTPVTNAINRALACEGLFRIGDSSFTLASTAGTAQLNTVATDPITGIQSVQNSTATLSTWRITALRRIQPRS
jgi:hypothetical protein